MTEAEGVSKKFDPRFSPAFQPGYDSRVHREAPPTQGLRDESVTRRDSRVTEPRFAGPPSFAVPASDGSVDGLSVAGTRIAGGGTAGSGAAGSGAAGSDVASLAWWQRVNPWFLVLWVLGIVFIGAGVGIVLWAVNGQLGAGGGNSNGQFFFIFLQTAWTVSPMIIALGLATITSTVVIKAAQWRRR